MLKFHVSERRCTTSASAPQARSAAQTLCFVCLRDIVSAAQTLTLYLPHRQYLPHGCSRSHARRSSSKMLFDEFGDTEPLSSCALDFFTLLSLAPCIHMHVFALA